MCLYLSKRQGTYYFRRVIPELLRPAFDGASAFTFSLRTKDQAEAKRRRSEHAVRTDQLLEDAKTNVARAAPVPPSEPAPGSTTRQRRRVRRSSTWVGRKEYAEMRQAVFSEEQAARDDHYLERFDEAERELERRLAGSTADLSAQEQLFRRILRERDFAVLVAEEHAGAARATVASQMAPDLASRQSATIQTETADRASGTSLHDLAQRCSAERKVRPKTADARRAVVRWFSERAGIIAVENILRKDVLAFKDAMMAEGTTPTNANVKLSRLKTLLQYAVENDYLAENPAKGVSVADHDRAKNKRIEFDLLALKALFDSPVYAHDERPAQGRGEAAYWLPLLAVYSGARLEELGQLRPSDVVEETYHDGDYNEQSAWVLRITEDEEEGLHLKNAGSRRIVPVHPELIRLGFVRFVQDAKHAGRSRLFDALKPDKYGRVTAKWGEWFSLYRRNVCGVTSRRMTFHSFRHTFKHYARHVSMTEGVQRQIMGHASGDVADDYGSGYTLHSLVEGMKSYRIVGFSPPSPPPAYRI